MKVNSIDEVIEPKTNNLLIYAIAIIGVFIIGYFIQFVFNLLSWICNLIIKFWFVVIIFLIILIFFKIKKKKK